MSHFNPIFVPTLILSLLLFALGSRLAARNVGRKARAFWISASIAATLPALLFDFYYTHLLDRAIWFYAFRSLPYTELAAGFAGFGTGIAAGALRTVSFVKGSGVLRWFVPAAILFVLVLVLVVPYSKPLIAPITTDFREEWTHGVCIQSTASTCGPCSAATILRWYGRPASERALAWECFSYGGGTENWYIARALRRRGLEVHYIQTAPQPTALPYPSIAGTRIGGSGAGHFIAILANRDGRYLIGDPIGGRSLLTPIQMRRRYYLTGFFVEVRDPRPKADSSERNRDLDYSLRGEIHVGRYRSRSLGLVRRLHVYTPPGYDAAGARRYPVLYLLHGSGGDDSFWPRVGDAQGILDGLIASGQCEPMIVVMPAGEVPAKRYGSHGFERDLLDDIVPWIERTYLVPSDAAGRGIAGFSMGGFQSIKIGLNHRDQFDWIGVFSAGLRDGWVTEADLRGHGTEARSQQTMIKLVYIRIGRTDFFLRDARRFRAWLARRSIPTVYQEVDGGHELSVWESGLADFAPRIFKAGADRSTRSQSSGRQSQCRRTT